MANKVKIKKRASRKRKITTKEKIFAGVGLASNLIGGTGGFVTQQSPQTRLVSRNSVSGVKTSSNKSLLQKIFGINTAYASISQADFLAEAAVTSLADMQAKYGNDLQTYIDQWLNSPNQAPESFSANSLVAYVFNLPDNPQAGTLAGIFTFGDDNMWHNPNFVSNNSSTPTNTNAVPDNFAFNDAYKVLGLSNNYSLINNGHIAPGIYANKTYYQLQSDYSYKKTASGDQVKSLILNGGISVGTVFVAKKLGIISKIMGMFKGNTSSAAQSAGASLPAPGNVLTEGNWEMSLEDTVDQATGDTDPVLGLDKGMQSQVTTATGAQITLEKAASLSQDPVLASQYGLGGIVATTVGGVTIGIAATVVGTGSAVGVATGVSANITFAGGGSQYVVFGGTGSVPYSFAPIPSTLSGTGSAAGGGTTLGGLGGTGGEAGVEGATGGSSSIFSSINSALHGAANAVHAALNAAATWVGGLFGMGAVGGSIIIGGGAVGIIFGIRAILNHGQDKIRDSKRIEEVNPFIFQIVNSYNSTAGNTIEEETIFHDEAQKAVLQIYQSAAVKFERSQSEASQSLYIGAYLHGGDVPGPNGQMVHISGMDATFTQRMAAHREALNFDVYESTDGTRIAYPPQGNGAWGKVTVTKNSSGVVTSVTSETGQIVPLSILSSILAADGERLHSQGNILMLLGVELPLAKVGESYSTTFPSAGAVGNISWSLISGNLPPGINFNEANGSISGVPEQEGSYNFVVGITDSTGQSHSQQYTIHVQAQQRTMDDIINNANVIQYSTLSDLEKQQLDAFLLANPNALLDKNFDSFHPGTVFAWYLGLGDGIIINQKASDLGFVYDDASGLFVRSSSNNSGQIIINTPAFPQGAVNTPYMPVQLEATGGTGPYSWKIFGGLPAGLYFSQDGILSGTPLISGTYTFSIQVTDSLGQTAVLSGQTLTINQTTPVAGAASMLFENPVSHNLSFKDGDSWQLSITNAQPGSPIYIDGTWTKLDNSVVSLHEMVGTVGPDGNAVISRQLSSYHAGNWNIKIIVGGVQLGGNVSFVVGAAPVITGLSVNSGRRGQSVEVVVKGSAVNTFNSIQFKEGNPGIHIHPIPTSNNPNEQHFLFVIDPDASLGTVTVVFTNNAGISVEVPFTVLP